MSKSKKESLMARERKQAEELKKTRAEIKKIEAEEKKRKAENEQRVMLNLAKAICDEIEGGGVNRHPALQILQKKMTDKDFSELKKIIHIDNQSQLPDQF